VSVTGNSLSAILDGVGRLTFLKRGEDYLITMPYAHCKGEFHLSHFLFTVVSIMNMKCNKNLFLTFSYKNTWLGLDRKFTLINYYNFFIRSHFLVRYIVYRLYI